MHIIYDTEIFKISHLDYRRITLWNFYAYIRNAIFAVQRDNYMEKYTDLLVWRTYIRLYNEFFEKQAGKK